MAKHPEFSLGDMLKQQLAGVPQDVPNSGTREQIEYLELDRLDPDPRNFYNLAGLDALTANIELLGVQQPLRVRPGEDGRYTVVSGHRRREALLRLAAEDPEKWRTVPCIVERDQASPALQELRLIWANRDTRTLTNADLMQQTERITELIYQLKEEGMEFTGRTRDLVAEICNIKKSKIARLDVIRKNLREPFKGQFGRNELSEDAAYHIARMPEDVQAALAEATEKMKKPVSGNAAEYILNNLDRYSEQSDSTCRHGGEPCGNFVGMLRATATIQYSWHFCAGRCCLGCYRRSDCSGACGKAREKKKLDAENEKNEKAKQEQEQKKRREENHKKSVAAAKKLLPVIEAAGLPEDAEIRFETYGPSESLETLRAWAAGGNPDATLYKPRFCCTGTDRAVELAKLLHCSTDFLLGLTEDPHPAGENGPGLAAGGGWTPGDVSPGEEPGYCAVIVEQEGGYRSGDIYRWTGQGWEYFGLNFEVEVSPKFWMRLPEAPKNESDE